MTEKYRYLQVNLKILSSLFELLIKNDISKDLLNGIKDLLSKDIENLVLGFNDHFQVEDENFTYKDLKIILKNRKVLVNGIEANLTPKEFDILYFLAKNQGTVFTKEQIYNAVWEESYLLDDSNIMAFIRKIRKKIEKEPDNPQYILTIWGIGYKFNDET